jgi:hypothetical protein
MNNLAQYFVPQWISIAFLIAIPIPFLLITQFVRKEAANTPYAKAYFGVLAFFLFYLSYIYLAHSLGLFKQIYFPPKVLLFTTFPFAVLLFGLVINTKVYKAIMETTKVESLVKLHVFRLIGVFFVLLALYDTLPKTFAFIAGIGDMVTALGSIYVAKAIQNKKSYSKTLCYGWNIFGTIDILFTAIAANVLTLKSIETGSMGVDTLATFPFCIIPAFAPPIILFLHLAIFRKLKKFSV